VETRSLLSASRCLMGATPAMRATARVSCVESAARPRQENVEFREAPFPGLKEDPSLGVLGCAAPLGRATAGWDTAHAGCIRGGGVLVRRLG
jgi:hypothetical protein